MEKVTVYFNSGLCGMGKLEGRLESVDGNSVMVVPKRCRKARWLTTYYQPYILVVKGWGHPEVPSKWEPAEDHGDCVVQRGKYSACDPRVESDFHSAVQFNPSEVVVELGREEGS